MSKPTGCTRSIEVNHSVSEDLGYKAVAIGLPNGDMYFEVSVLNGYHTEEFAFAIFGPDAGDCHVPDDRKVDAKETWDILCECLMLKIDATGIDLCVGCAS